MENLRELDAMFPVLRGGINYWAVVMVVLVLCLVLSINSMSLSISVFGSRDFVTWYG